MKLSISRWLPVRTLVSEYPFWLIIALAVSMRLYGVTHSPLWFDEAFSALISAGTPSSIWSISADDIHPPLYYLLLHGWMIFFGNSVFSIRMMSVLLGVLTVIMAVRLVQVVATRRAAIVGGMLLAFLPVAVRYSQEARMYALLALLCITATWALVFWIKNPERHRYLGVYAMMMAAGFYTHYFVVPCLLSHWLYVLLTRQSGCSLLRKPAWWLANFAVFVFFLPWLPSFIAQLSSAGPLNWIPRITGGSVLSLAWQYMTLEFGSDWPWLAYVLIPSMILALIVMLLKLDSDNYRFNLLLVLYTFAPILIIALVSLQLPLFWPRYFLFSAIGLPLLIGIGLDRLLNTHVRLGIVGLVIVLSLQCFGLYNVYAGRFKYNNPYQQLETHVDEAMSYVNSKWTPGDRVLIHGFYIYPAAVYYNKTGTASLLYTPGAPLEGRPDKRGGGALFYQEADDLYINDFKLIPAGTRRVWFLYETSGKLLDVPKQWQPVSYFTAGATQLWLYSLEQTAPR